VSAIPAGSGLVVVGAGGPLLLADSGGGTVVAHTAVCTHQGATLDGAGICPLHGSRFDVKTGAVLAGPATAPLKAVPVKVSGGEVFPG
jgi:cytochrome b6-f complex iron-sulfur subunit